jgi:DNA-directed RNA polymerase specialized sigma subunit
MSFYYDDGFKLFTQTLEAVLARTPSYNEEELIVHQRDQIRRLVALETQFRKTLIAHRSGPATYKAFVQMICKEKGNILAARPYFRERQKTFTKYISKALKRESGPGLYRFRINWTFISWVMKYRKWAPASGLPEIANQIYKLRKELLEENLPLSISQARGFYGSTPRSHLTFMDVVQIQCQGLLLAIDKFCPPKEKGLTEKQSLDLYRGFRAVAIGIMIRDRVNDYSQTLVHFYPRDRQKIYWANKMLRRFVDEVDHNQIAQEINLNLSEDERTSAEEIADLLTTASVVSADYTADPEGESMVDLAVGDSSLRPDVRAEEDDLHSCLISSMSKLSLMENKLLRLKGINNNV